MAESLLGQALGTDIPAEVSFVDYMVLVGMFCVMLAMIIVYFYYQRKLKKANK